MDETEIKHFIESALLAAGRPLNVDQLQNLFDVAAVPEKSQVRQAISTLQDEYADRGIIIKEVASGFRIQIKAGMADRLQKLWEDRPPRYSRALFETLALIAYRQPVTRGEIEEIRGVSVSTNIVRSLLEREWVRVVGHRDVPGRPAMFGTTKQFLDYFGLKKLDDLPPLADLSDWETLRVQLNLPAVEEDEVPVETAEVMDLPVLQPEVDGVEVPVDTGTVTDLPVLYPERKDVSDEEDRIGTDELPQLATDTAEDTEADTDEVPELTTDTGENTEADTDELPELIADTGFHEIVATEWPEPDAGDSPEQGQAESADANDLDEKLSGT
jgi:segregation and condensation protein B